MTALKGGELFNEDDIKKISDKLIRLLGTEDMKLCAGLLFNYYPSNENIEKIKIKNIKEDILKIKGNNNYIKTKKLRTIISKKLSKKYSKKNESIHNWIVNNWGGIKWQVDEKKVQSFLKNTNDIKSNIASLTKIASFYQPKKYFVYDSRVAFAINALINLSLPNHRNKYFHLPPGRNRTIEPYKKKYKRKNNIKDYTLYCELIKGIAKYLNVDGETIEMILFSIASNQLIANLKSTNA